MLPLAAVITAPSSEAPAACCLSHALLAQASPQPPAQAAPFQDWPKNRPAALDPKEARLKNALQLTFGGQNAEAYWSPQPGFPDEQIFTMDADGGNRRLISAGLGRTTCSYFSPDGQEVYFSSTHEKSPGAQPRPDMSQGYVWMVNPNLGLYKRLADGRIVPILKRRGYVAETTIAPDGSFMTFTGGFEGDLEIYRASLDGSNIRRLTNEYGYDGGPFVSWDGRKIVYRRAPAFTRPEERAEYTRLWKQNMVRPGRMDIWIMDADGRNKRQVTRLPGASFAPFIHPDGRRIIFCSNFHDPKGREFDLFMVNIDGSGLRQITFTPDFDGFPMFTRDGRRLVWASNRQGSVRGETNVFAADWVD
jgi:Tol biopolymer transport system component